MHGTRTTSARHRRRDALAALLLALSVVAHAGDTAAPTPLAVGDSLPALGLHDQHGAAAAIDPATKLLLFTRDMDGGGFVKDTLADGGAAKLAAARATYVSDVSGMPSAIRSMFALPSIRRRPYPVILDESGTAMAAMPYRKGTVTMLTLDSGRITAIEYATTAEALEARLSPPAKP